MLTSLLQQHMTRRSPEKVYGLQEQREYRGMLLEWNGANIILL
jgi:hypothetical protein